MFDSREGVLTKGEYFLEASGQKIGILMNSDMTFRLTGLDRTVLSFREEITDAKLVPLYENFPVASTVDLHILGSGKSDSTKIPLFRVIKGK